MTQELANVFDRTHRARLDDLEARIRDLKGSLPRERRGLRAALELVSHYPNSARSVQDAEASLYSNIRSRVQSLQLLLLHTAQVASLVENWFSRGSELIPPFSQERAIHREAEDLFGGREVILVPGSADNFLTFVPDLEDVVFSTLGPRRPSLPSNVSGKKYAIMQVPSMQGGSGLWRPVLAHELAHLKVDEEQTVSNLNLESRFDWTGAAQIPGPLPTSSNGLPIGLTLLEIVKRWAEELICDAYALRRFGVCAIPAIGEFLASVGAASSVSVTHPPAGVRVEMLLNWLEGSRPNWLDSLLAPWNECASWRPDSYAPWIEFVESAVKQEQDNIYGAVTDWCDSYSWEDSTGIVARLTESLLSGIPECQYLEARGEEDENANIAEDASIAEADAILSGWVALNRVTEVPVARLVDKSLESLEFINLWRHYGGSGTGLGEALEQAESQGGVLSDRLIAERLRRTDSGRLVITPTVEGSISGGSADVRLGPRFIVFRKAGTASFSALDTGTDPRSLQSMEERAWGEAIVLHPGNMVLASTLEFISMPEDLVGHVVTRSSYGRLGLVTATAVMVQPWFKGCLTLELVNQGEVPIELVPGERIAQIGFSTLGAAAREPEQKYRCPTGPEFSRVSQDDDVVILREMRGHSRGR